MNKLYFEIIDIDKKGYWDELVMSNHDFNIFHLFDWLRITAKHTKFELIPYIFYFKNSPVAILPFFKKYKFGHNLIFSPPPNSSIPELGLYFLNSNFNQYDKEKINYEIAKNIKNIKHSAIYFNNNNNDIRAYLWRGFSIEPRYTYEIDLSINSNDLIQSFYKQTRTDLRRALKNKSISFKINNEKDIININNHVNQRYKEQGIKRKFTNNYLTDLYESFKDKFITISAYVDEQFYSGLILLKNDFRLMHWLGGTSPKKNIIGIVELLHWKSIEYGKKNNFEIYELVGANTKHLCTVKSKYNPKERMYFSIEDKTYLFALIEKIYFKILKRIN